MVFDEIFDRKGTSCKKYDALDEYFGSENLFPLWIADMDFKTPDFIKKAVQQKSQSDVYGYFIRDDSFYEAIISWNQKRNNWILNKQDISFSPGIVPAIGACLQAFSKQGDEIIIQPPVYSPFFSIIQKHNRTLITNPLILKNKRYHFDINDFKSKITNKTKIFILCSPHNPGGAVWHKEELEEILNICVKNDIYIVSDEIHSDLVLSSHKHTPVPSINEHIAQKSISLMSPSKAFNIAGLSSAYAISKNQDMIKAFANILNISSLDAGNIFGDTALIAAYNEGQEWLEGLIDYIGANIKFLLDFMKSKMPLVEVIEPEASYLVWLNFKAFGLSHSQIQDLLIKKAKVALNDGTTFGKQSGECFFRINIALPRERLKKALDSIYSAFSDIK